MPRAKLVFWASFLGLPFGRSVIVVSAPVEAVAPSWRYKAKKTFQKHRVACLAAGLRSLVLIGATIFSTYWAISSARANGRLEKQSIELQEQVVKSKRLETRAVEAEQQAVELARERQNEAVQARAISKFVFETSRNPAIKTSKFHSLVRRGLYWCCLGSLT